MSKKDPILVINWGPTKAFPKEVKCECGQKSFTSDIAIENFHTKYGSYPIFVCVVCAIKKYSKLFTVEQFKSLENYYRSITN